MTTGTGLRAALARPVIGTDVANPVGVALSGTGTTP